MRVSVSNRLGDARIAEFHDARLENGLADDTRLDQRVRVQIAEALSEGAPTIGESRTVSQ